uniref:Putative Cyclase/dehydrase n=1 Tax=mine drainage metagenome TaxID=410659 RepID=E6QKP8_9ZZZZ
MPEKFETSQWVPYPVEMVFAFFANPANLPHLMPAWQQPRIESSRIQAPPARPVSADPALRFQSPAAGAGSEMLFSFRPFPGLPLRLKWLAHITEFVWFSHFTDEQVVGPFAAWQHRHQITPETRETQSGTCITDKVEYTLPMGPLGSLANALFVRSQMHQTFAYRQRRLEQILPVVARQAARRS